MPVTAIRAGIIIGHGGISWELTRQLVEHLSVRVTAQWVATRAQPIAVDNVVRYLAGVLEPPAASGQVYEVGGPGCAAVLDDAASRRCHRGRQRGGGTLLPRRLVVRATAAPTTTLAHAASTAATGNPALVLAGLITSAIFGWQRAATGGVLAPALTHVTWSVLMLRYLPPLFRGADRPPDLH